MTTRAETVLGGMLVAPGDPIAKHAEIVIGSPIPTVNKLTRGPRGRALNTTSMQRLRADHAGLNHRRIYRGRNAYREILR